MTEQEPDIGTLKKGQRVRIIGPDAAGDNDALGLEGEIVRYRGGEQYWVEYLTGDYPKGVGTTYDLESLKPLNAHK